MEVNDVKKFFEEEKDCHSYSINILYIIGYHIKIRAQ